MTSDNLVSDIAEGTTKGFLEWSTERITSLAKKIKEHKLAFIEEKKTIEIVKQQYNCGEIKFYERYIQDKELLLLVRMGLTLRKLEEDEERLLNLRDKIHMRYGPKGLHIAQFAQNGILNRYFGLLIEKLTSEEELKDKMYDVLKNIEKYALFVPANSKVAEIIRKTTTVIDSHSPSIYVIAGLKSAAPIASEAIISLEPVMESYDSERFSSKDKEIIIFKQKLR
ncbi:hypothetical protein HYX13_00395 [Candidatus Woesearchaeota archaeon]|nr:hypothetical protein [Candidatus Woesearchaeota archaeon]